MASLGPGGDDDEPPPRFAARGPDADEFGAAAGYPMGDRVTFFTTGSLVGSHSHLDEIFPGRLIQKAPTPSRLVRVAEPRITWTFQGVPLTLDDYLARVHKLPIDLPPLEEGAALWFALVRPLGG